MSGRGGLRPCPQERGAPSISARRNEPEGASGRRLQAGVRARPRPLRRSESGIGLTNSSWDGIRPAGGGSAGDGLQFTSAAMHVRLPARRRRRRGGRRCRSLRLAQRRTCKSDSVAGSRTRSSTRSLSGCQRSRTSAVPLSRWASSRVGAIMCCGRAALRSTRSTPVGPWCWTPSSRPSPRPARGQLRRRAARSAVGRARRGRG
jgi:hypothetical protein